MVWAAAEIPAGLEHVDSWQKVVVVVALIAAPLIALYWKQHNRIVAVHAELSNNSGSSLKDAIDRIEARQKAWHEQDQAMHATIDRRLDMLEGLHLRRKRRFV